MISAKTATPRQENTLETNDKTLFYRINFGAGEGIRTLDPNLGKVASVKVSGEHQNTNLTTVLNTVLKFMLTTVVSY